MCGFAATRNSIFIDLCCVEFLSTTARSRRTPRPHNQSTRKPIKDVIHVSIYLFRQNSHFFLLPADRSASSPSFLHISLDRGIHQWTDYLPPVTILNALELNSKSKIRYFLFLCCYSLDGFIRQTGREYSSSLQQGVCISNNTWPWGRGHQQTRSINTDEKLLSTSTSKLVYFLLNYE